MSNFPLQQNNYKDENNSIVMTKLYSEDNLNNMVRAAGFAVAGAGVGALVAEIACMRLALGGIAIATDATPVIVAGGLLGLAAYEISRAFSD